MSTKYPQGVITATPPYKSTTAQNFSGVWTLEQLANNYYYYKQAIGNSLRFRSSASAYLNRTPSFAGNQRTWTWSGWVKRGTLGSAQVLFSSDVGTSNSTWLEFGFDAGDTFTVTSYTTDVSTTSAVFRDPSSWYHIVVAFDSTQPTTSNRCRIYFNGVQQSLTGVGFTLNATYGINAAQAHAIGQRNWSSGVGRYFDGYMAEINFIDGQALDPSYFGQISTVTGVWSPAPYTGSYGTNGFYLPFNNGTSTITLGFDGRSGVQNVLITEGDGSAQTIYAGYGACVVSTISTANASLPSASNEYLVVTPGPAVAVTSSLKIYFDVDKTWANGRNLYINGSAVSTANITTALVSGMYEWTINYSAAGITSISSFTTPQNSGGRAVFYGFSVNGSTIYSTGNVWTCNNISLTAGSTYDWMLDSPTPYQGSSYGVGNYAVLNPLSPPWNTTLSNANLTATIVGSAGGRYVGSMVFGNKTWFEFRPSSIGATNAVTVGVIRTDNSITSASLGAQEYTYRSNGQKGNNGAWSAYGAAFTSADTIGIAFDPSAGTLEFYKQTNSTGSFISQGVAYTVAAGSYTPVGVLYDGGDAASINFGQRPFNNTTIPSGYKSLCTYNLPTPTIQNGSNFMAATLYTGTSAAQTIVNANNSVSFQPDFVWVKSRSAATDHKLTDSVRGATKGLISDSTGAETTDTTGLTAFGVSGFTLGANTTYNNSGATYVGWQWKAGGTAVTNTAGSITSSVSANTTSGFSVVTYTGTGANATVGHGLGIAPSMIINKSRNSAQNWTVFHAGLANMTTAYVRLNTTDAAGTLGNAVATPTSTTFGISASTADTSTYVAYCFAAIPGFSAFGSYTGNGSSDGPFVYCGFRPRYILVKNITTAVNEWQIMDTSRDPYNVGTHTLYADSSSAELTVRSFDILSNGFKLRDNSGDQNGSGSTYIYAAFAENPFNYSLAR